jgi:hypothetical protein
VKFHQPLRAGNDAPLATFGIVPKYSGISALKWFATYFLITNVDKNGEQER